jgi:hypothetical protein
MMGGMSLNNLEREHLATVDPSLLQAMYANSSAGRKASAKETVRQRGLARGEAKASRRQYDAMTAPKMIGISGATGNWITSPGMAPQVASAMAMSGGGAVDPLMAAMSGLLPPNAAAAMNQTAMLDRANQTEAAGMERREGMAPLLAALGSENPAAQQWALGQLQGGGMQPNQGVAFQPGGEVAFSPEDEFMLNGNLKGNPNAIEAYGRSRGWTDQVIDNAKKQYGKKSASFMSPYGIPYTGTGPSTSDTDRNWLEQGVDSLYGALFGRGIGVPAPVGANPNRRRR